MNLLVHSEHNKGINIRYQITMTSYPTRSRMSKDDYQASCVEGEAWNLIDSVFKGEQAMAFPPGSLTFGLTGFLGIASLGALLIFTAYGLLGTAPIPVRGSFIFIGALVVSTIHAVFMLRVALGVLFAQDDLIRYLSALFILSCGFAFYAVLRAYEAPLLYFPIAGALLTLMLIRMAKSGTFSLYANLMRVKRVYMKERQMAIKNNSKPKRRAL